MYALCSWHLQCSGRDNMYSLYRRQGRPGYKFVYSMSELCSWQVQRSGCDDMHCL
eukprot:COSAG01_NODE_70759_length_257_cov_4.215190_1_plen_54_part_01